ncbi:MAG: hypothetical protein ACLUFV_07295 [Acutalibacteraceae bacterium]
MNSASIIVMPAAACSAGGSVKGKHNIVYEQQKVLCICLYRARSAQESRAPFLIQRYEELWLFTLAVIQKSVFTGASQPQCSAANSDIVVFSLERMDMLCGCVEKEP